MRYHSYLNTAKKIIETNTGEVPFAVFLKKYFGANKKYGSKDRKQIAALCYNFYRLGKALPQSPIEEKIITAVFLNEKVNNGFLEFHNPGWNTLIAKPVFEKLALSGFTAENIFPWTDELSPAVDPVSFCFSFLDQPDLFLRIRPGNTDTVINKLEEAGLKFKRLQDDCISLPNSTKLEELLEINKEVIVQDHHSQQVLNFLKNEGSLHGNPCTVWDCCAASGGKSILAFDILKGKMELTVSDIRENSLTNLKKRFESAGIKNYRSFVTDLSADLKFPGPAVQLIICDAPCTGSGTWSRTPEQLYFFKQKNIDIYVAKQQRIVSNTVPYLQEGGIFIYITCSVFKKENEAIADYIIKKFHLQLLQMELLKGYDKKSDSMFVAVFKKV